MVEIPITLNRDRELGVRFLKPPKLPTEIRITPDKASYEVGEIAHCTQGLYRVAGVARIIGRTVDYEVFRDGVRLYGWSQRSDTAALPDITFTTAGTYTITGSFAGDGTYEASSKTITITPTVPPPPPPPPPEYTLTINALADSTSVGVDVEVVADTSRIAITTPGSVTKPEGTSVHIVAPGRVVIAGEVYEFDTYGVA